MNFLVQFGINKHLLIFSKTTNFVSLLLVLIYSKLHSKSCDYLYLQGLLSKANVQSSKEIHCN